MLNIISQLIHTAISLLYGYLLYQVICKFLTTRWPHPLVNFFVIIILFSTSNIVVYASELTGIVGFFISFTLILLIFYENEWYLKVSAAILIFPAVIAINYITQDIGLLIWQRIFDENMSQVGVESLHLATMFLRIPIWYLIYQCVKNWIPYTSRLLTRRMWLILDMIAMTSYIGIITVIYNVDQKVSYTAYPTCIACLITTLGCCYLCTYMARTVKADMEIETYQYQHSYYQELEQSQQTVRRLRHDMKNHLNVIDTFLRNKDYEQADQYLRELNQEFTSNICTYCPSGIVNAVLNSKAQLAADSNISCKFQIDLEEAPVIKDIDLCSILGNTLDNAIEACRKIPQTSKRSISVKARCKNGFFSYDIINTKVNDIIKEKETFITDKKDSSSHGIGLKTLKTIVEKYDGTIDISYDEDSFHIILLIHA